MCFLNAKVELIYKNARGLYLQLLNTDHEQLLPQRRTLLCWLLSSIDNTLGNEDSLRRWLRKYQTSALVFRPPVKSVMRVVDLIVLGLCLVLDLRCLEFVSKRSEPKYADTTAI